MNRSADATPPIDVCDCEGKQIDVYATGDHFNSGFDSVGLQVRFACLRQRNDRIGLLEQSIFQPAGKSK